LLWDKLANQLPEDCRGVVAGTPALVRPRVGIIFGFAAGTHTIGLRLPPSLAQSAVREGARRSHRHSDGATLDTAMIGPEWVLLGWHRLGAEWCRAAYDYAAGVDGGGKEKRPAS
jgi:hypothetical protein